MGKIVEKKKKKKGRPSLLDIQKRNLRLQKQQQQHQKKRNPNPNSTTSIPPNSNSNSNSTPHRRYTRRNPNPEDVSADNSPDDDDDNDDNDDDDDSKGTRRERKLNHVLRVNSNQRSSVNSPYLDLGLYGSDSNEDDDENGETPLKKRKINAATTATGDGSALNVTEKGEKQNSPWKATEKHIGIPSVSGPTTTPLPDKKLLVFILDRLQKKDTYGVYAEPVDPEELPDYHEIIENPMDFGTVRKKLEDGAYPTLEQFENDVFLICSNAMQYNAPDTVYFKQARRIQELAKKSFENLRQDSDNEQRPKIAARRGRPPTKHLKKPLEKTTSERDGLDATLTKGGDGAIWSNSYNLRKSHVSDRYASADTSRRTLYGSRSGEAYSWLSENNNDKTDDFLGKGFFMKYGKRPFVSDESRRGTYMNFHPLVVGSESSVLNTFDGETKQLLPVGLHTEHGYARSLARFAADLGPVAWKVASKRIERALPPGMKFGPGWVGDDEAPPLQTSSLTTQQQPSSTQTSLSAAAPLMLEQKGDILLKQDITGNSSLDGYPNRTFPYTVASSSTIVSESLDPVIEPAEVAGRVKDGGFGLMNNGSCGMRPPFQVHQSPLGNPGMNGFSGGFGPNHLSQMGKLARPVWSSGSINCDASVHSRILDMASKGNFIHSTPANRSELYNPKLLGGSSVANSGTFMPNSNHEAQGGIGVGVHGQACWNGLLLQQKPDLIPPDLNVRFQSPGSPSSSVRVDSPQPDLALQL